MKIKTLVVCFLILVQVVGCKGASTTVNANQSQNITQNPDDPCRPKPIAECNSSLGDSVINYVCKDDILFSQPATCFYCPQFTECLPVITG